MTCPTHQKTIHMPFTMVASTTILVALLATTGTLFLNGAYAEDPKEIYEQTKLAAEIEFAETIQDAKAQYHAVLSNHDADSDAIQKAKQEYNKAVADAKVLRDQKIDDAVKAYESSMQTNIVIPESNAKDEFLQKIDEARKTYETALIEAKENFDDAISQAADAQTEEQLKDEYERTLSQIKQVYNDAIAQAQEEYNKIRNSEVI